MIVVSNAGPLISLSRIERLDLLRLLFEVVHIPEAVFRETAGGECSLPGVSEIKASTWIKRTKIGNMLAVELLRERLDAGEAEAIVLSLEMKADLLLIDEARGRRVAGLRGVDIIGSFGLLVVAKRRGLIPKVAPILEELISSGFRIRDDLYAKALELAGEKRSLPS